MKRSLVSPPRQPTTALVLLSGGVDSVAAMHYAKETYSEVACLSFWYGQPHSREVDVARVLAHRRGVTSSVIHLCEAVRGHEVIPVPEAGAERGVSRANLPARNMILLASAAAHAMRLWPGRLVHLVVGATVDDAPGFPDCRHPFLEQAQGALDMAVRGVGGIRVDAPWCLKRKADVVRWCAERPDALTDIRESVSCYAGTGCGLCDSCRLRASAFAEAGVEDGGGMFVPTCGGDAHREASP